MALRLNHHKQRIILVIVAFITIGLMIASLRFERLIGNQRTMFYQLQVLRTSVNLYKAITKENPKSLLELATASYQFPGEDTKRRYLENPIVDKEGMLVDPFGNRYVYEIANGWVKSSTKGYEYW